MIDIITTLTDAVEYAQEQDIRSIKSNLNLGHVRCKSPEMVHRELWTAILGYNLIRMTAASAAVIHDNQPRQISFTSTCQYILASWVQLTSRLMDQARTKAYVESIPKQLSRCEVANRPGRLEPRVLKRRRHGYKHDDATKRRTTPCTA